MNNTQKFLATKSVLRNQDGAIGYILAWLLGVPVSILLVVFLLRGGT